MTALSVFAELIQKYPTWDSLRIFLMSKEGGNLRVITNDDELAIIRYTKGVSDFENENSVTPYFRSVVWNKTTNRPVSVAPPKAQQGMPDKGCFHVSDFVEGTMIQAFCLNGQIRIATRTSLDARGSFYSTRSFAELLNDVFQPMGGTTEFLKSVLNEGEFVSLVLQHPEHKMVKPINAPRAYVTYFGSVHQNNHVSLRYSTTNWPVRLISYSPHVFENGILMEEGDAQTLIRSQAQIQGYSWQGMVFQDNLGNRWRIRNAAYTAVRTLRGSEANAMERFVRLRVQGHVKKYLDYFREESGELWGFEQTLRQRTQELYDAYKDMNKLKTKTMKDLPYCMRPHVYALHGKYLASISGGSGVKPILKETVVAYVNNLPADEQFKLLQGDRVGVASPAT